LPFLGSKHTPENRANFKKAPLVKEKLWEYLFCYEEELQKEDQNSLPTKRNSE